MYGAPRPLEEWHRAPVRPAKVKPTPTIRSGLRTRPPRPTPHAIQQRLNSQRLARQHSPFCPVSHCYSASSERLHVRTRDPRKTRAAAAGPSGPRYQSAAAPTASRSVAPALKAPAPALGALLKSSTGATAGERVDPGVRDNAVVLPAQEAPQCACTLYIYIPHAHAVLALQHALRCIRIRNSSIYGECKTFSTDLRLSRVR